MEGDPNGTPGAETTTPTVEVVRGDVAGDIRVVTQPDEPIGAPDGEQADLPSDTADEVTEGDADAEALAAAEAADRADLEQYPESVRDYLKGIPQEHRKTLHEHFGQRERARMLEEQERANKLEAQAREAEARAQAVRESEGKFVGVTPIDLVDVDGNTVPGPTYDELASALQTRRGREMLADKYGLSEANAEATKAELDERRAMLSSSASHFDDLAWGKLAAKMQDGLAAIPGVEPDAVIAAAAKVASEGGNAPAEVLRLVVAARDAEHAREMAAQKTHYEGRLGGLTANQEAMRGRVVAAESRRLATGGRTGGGSAMSTLDRLKAEAGSEEQFIENAKAGMYAGIDLSK